MKPTTLSKSATVYDADGFVTSRRVWVTNYGKEVSVDGIFYPANELVIESDRLTHKRAKWMVRF